MGGESDADTTGEKAPSWSQVKLDLFPPTMPPMSPLIEFVLVIVISTNRSGVPESMVIPPVGLPGTLGRASACLIESKLIVKEANWSALPPPSMSVLAFQFGSVVADTAVNWYVAAVAAMVL